MCVWHDRFSLFNQARNPKQGGVLNLVFGHCFGFAQRRGPGGVKGVASFDSPQSVVLFSIRSSPKCACFAGENQINQAGT